MADATAPDLTGDNRKIWEANPPTFVDRRVETILELLPRIGPQAKLLDVFSWNRGEYLFRQDAPMPLEAIQLPMSNASLIAEGIRSCYGSDRVLAALGPFLDRYLTPATDPQLRFQELQLDEIELDENQAVK